MKQKRELFSAWLAWLPVQAFHGRGKHAIDVLFLIGFVLCVVALGFTVFYLGWEIWYISVAKYPALAVYCNNEYISKAL